MLRFLRLCFGTLVRLFRARRSLLLENLALRQQLVVLKRRHPRPSLGTFDRLFWTGARRFWSGWKRSLIIVTPETVVRWHRTGFRLYWKLISRARKRVGRRQTPKEMRDLIFRMVAENPTWGAPRIHGELLMLDFDVSERTVSRWMKRTPRDPDLTQRWLTFLRNHREAIAAMDFFTAPGQVRRALLLLCHQPQSSTHSPLQRHQASHDPWIVQQLREAFPFESAPRFLIFDRDAKYGLEVPIAARSLKIDPVRAAFASPWQNGVPERWVESCRRDLLDHIIAMNEGHLKRLLSQYVRYYHEDRTHLGLAKGTPDAEVATWPLVASSLMSGWEGCIIVTIELLEPRAQLHSNIDGGSVRRLPQRMWGAEEDSWFNSCRIHMSRRGIILSSAGIRFWRGTPRIARFDVGLILGLAPFHVRLAV
jgi:putative transposase